MNRAYDAYEEAVRAAHRRLGWPDVLDLLGLALGMSLIVMTYIFVAGGN